MTDLLTAALAPQSIAVIGASENPHKIGGRPIAYMQRMGYRGKLYPINPSRRELQGLACYPSLAELPEVPEMAIVIVAGDQAIAAVEDCAARGVRCAVVIASGFGETGPTGKAQQDHMRDVARAAGMRLVGPNTQGLANFGTGAIASFSTLFTEMPPADGPIAVVSQSGGMAAMVYGLLRARGLGVRHVHATGNEADVGVADLAWAVAQDPEVKLLLLYLEHIANPALLAATAAHARQRGLPIVAVKAGRTAGGALAASSHTGSLANEDRVVDAFLRRHGIWRVRDPHALALAAPGYLQGWQPRGRRLVIVSNSGASCVMGADAAEQHGLQIANLSDTTRRELAARLPGFATTTNPIDITAALLSNSGLFSEVLPVLAQDDAADMVFIHIPVSGAGYDVERFARDTAAFAKASGKPVAVAAWQESVAAVFRAAGVATYANEDEALGALAQVAGHQALLREPMPAATEAAAPALPAGKGLLNEADSLALLAAQGVPVAAHRLCRSAEAARAAFAELGGPVAVKACSRDVPHKSEHGLVALNLQDADAVAAAFTQQWNRLASMGAAQEGVLVARMQRGRHEAMVGAHIDPQFGPVVAVGDGGKYVEAMRDVALLVPPFERGEVLQALRGLRIAPLLAGTRGDPGLDVEALADIAVRVGRLTTAAAGAIAAIDLNPVMLGPAGQGAVVVDALVDLGGAGAPLAPGPRS